MIDVVFSFVLVLFALMQGAMAYSDGMFLPSQMRKKYLCGFPLIANGAFWGELFILPYPLGRIIQECASEWSAPGVIISAMFGIGASWYMHNFVYRKGKFPDALASAEHGMTDAGRMNEYYFAIAVMLTTLFLFYSHPSQQLVDIVFGALALHVIVANHVPLMMLRSVFKWIWCPNVFLEERAPAIILSASIGALTILYLLKRYPLG